MNDKPLSIGASVAERTFYLSSAFDEPFTRKQAFEVFEKSGVARNRECLKALSNAGMVINAKPYHKKQLALYEVTEKGHLAATKFEKMIERAQRFIKELDE